MIEFVKLLFVLNDKSINKSIRKRQDVNKKTTGKYAEKQCVEPGWTWV